MVNSGNPLIIPVLSKAVESSKVKGVYIMQDKAEVGRIYQMICPRCKKTLIVKAKEPKTFIETCCYCNTKTAVVGTVKKAEAEESESLKQADQTNADNGNEDEPQRLKTEKVKMAPSKSSQSLAKLVWGGFLRRKSYLLHEGVNYIGRNDSEIPSDVNIDDGYVSRRSILIEVERGPKGFNYKLTVKKCTNPVLVNGKEQEVGNSIYLNYGDTILVGNTTLTFKSGK